MILSRLKPAFYGRAGRKKRHPIGEHSCTLYGAPCSVIEYRRALKRLLPTCSVFQQTALYGGRNRLQLAV